MRYHCGDRLASYRCGRTGEYLCLQHARLAVISMATREKLPPLRVRQVERKVTVG